MIELTGVTKKFDDVPVLNDITLKIESGTAYGLLGSNGAGKSTILRLLSGIYSAEDGTIKIDGEDIYDNPNAKQRVFFINDETVQFGNMTLKELKNYYKGFYPNFSEDIFEKLRKKINLPIDKSMNKFSKGMKRQAVVITGLASCCDYLLLDEAFDGLDPAMRIIVKHMLVDAMLDRNLTTIISSHNLKEINEICDSAALLHNGKIIFDCELDSLHRNIHKIQAVFYAPVKKEDFAELDLLHFEQVQSITYLIVKGDEGKIKECINSKSPTVFDLIPLTLEEIFIYEMEGMGYDVNGTNTEN